MPELAEVAIYAHDLLEITTGQKLKRVRVGGESKWRDKIVPTEVVGRLKKLINKEIDFRSCGKTLYLGDKHQSLNSIQFKLGMTGMFLLSVNEHQLNRHAFLILEFESTKIYYLDYRRFGRISLAQAETKSIGGYNIQKGFYIEPKSKIEEIVTQSIINKKNEIIRKPRITWLLDQGVRTGVGNYLANEALGRLNLSPFEPLPRNKVDALREANRIILMCGKIATDSFLAGGNSFKGGYFRLTGELGNFIEKCQFYRKLGIPCIIFNGRPCYTSFKLK